MALFSLDNAFFDGRAPGCYNDPDFRALEAKDPAGALNSYARFVLTRAMTQEEADRVRAAVGHVVNRLLERSSPSEIDRSCYAISMACLQTLEAAGIWGCVLKGAARFRFPLGTGIRDSFFWSNDRSAAGHKAGHAWLVVPPFQLIDMTAAFQRWTGREREFLPVSIMKESVNKRGFQQELVAPPEMRKGFRVPPEAHEFWKVFSPFEIEADLVQIFYQPHGVTAPAEPLAEASFVLGGRPAPQFIADEIQPGLERL